MLTLKCPQCGTDHGTQPDGIDSLQCPCGLIYEVRKGTWSHPTEIVPDNRIMRSKMAERLEGLGSLLDAMLGFWDFAVLEQGLPPEVFETLAWRRWESNMLMFMSRPPSEHMLVLEVDSRMVVSTELFQAFIKGLDKALEGPPAFAVYGREVHRFGWLMSSLSMAQERGREIWARVYRQLQHPVNETEIGESFRLKVQHLKSRVEWLYMSRKGHFMIPEKEEI